MCVVRAVGIFPDSSEIPLWSEIFPSGRFPLEGGALPACCPPNKMEHLIRISNQNCIHAVLIWRLRRKRCFALPLEMLRISA
jgi:hypothetical protein